MIPFLKKIVRVLFTLYGFLFFLLILFLLMPLVIVSSIFGPIQGGTMIYRICGLWADLLFPLIGLKVRIIHEAQITEHRPCVFVANHSSYMDIPMIVYAIREPVRPLGKAEMAKIPVFGFLYRRAAIMVDRSSAANRAKSVQVLKSVLSKNVSIFIFPEGTFDANKPGLQPFFDGAFRIAIETQTPIQPVIFPDTAKRLSANTVFSLSPGISRVVYLAEVPVTGLTRADLPMLKQTVYDRMNEALERYHALPL
jgi:1-acyl-sn-glycerol-3-phosphate acyltransferase